MNKDRKKAGDMKVFLAFLINNMKLTSKTYFSKKNTFISNSKCNDYVKCPNYFKKKHILHLVEQPITDALVIGSACDEWLTGSRERFETIYCVVPRRSRNETFRYQLTQKMYDEIVGMCEAVEATGAYKEIKKEKHRSQVILQKDIKIGEHFTGLCGIPDFFKVYKDGTCVITDLKTARDFEGSKTKYHYKCLSFGYYNQLAMYSILLKHKYPQIKSFKCRHLIINKDTDNIYNVFAWYLSDDRIEEAKEHINMVVEDIHNESDFAKLEASWNEDDIVGEYE